MNTIYETLSNYELIDLALSYREAMTGDVMNYVSLLTAYLIVSYLVGSKLTRSQVTIITTLYSAIIAMVIYGTIATATTFVAVNAQLLDTAPSFLPQGLGILLFTGWVVSILFMFQIRRRDPGIEA